MFSLRDNKVTLKFKLIVFGFTTDFIYMKYEYMIERERERDRH